MTMSRTGRAPVEAVEGCLSVDVGAAAADDAGDQVVEIIV